MEADQAFEWIVEGTEPSAIPTTPTAINELVEKVTPMAMERISGMIRASIDRPTAFPREMLEAIEQAFTLRLTQLFVERSRGGGEMPLWSAKRKIIEWLAAQYRDMAMLPPDEAMSKAKADYAADPVAASERAANFAGMVEAMTGVSDPRRVGNWYR